MFLNVCHPKNAAPRPGGFLDPTRPAGALVRRRPGNAEIYGKMRPNAKRLSTGSLACIRRAQAPSTMTSTARGRVFWFELMPMPQAPAEGIASRSPGCTFRLPGARPRRRHREAPRASARARRAIPPRRTASRRCGETGSLALRVALGRLLVGRGQVQWPPGPAGLQE